MFRNFLVFPGLRKAHEIHVHQESWQLAVQFPKFTTCHHFKSICLVHNQPWMLRTKKSLSKLNDLGRELEQGSNRVSQQHRWEDAKVSPETMHQKYPQIIWLVFNKSFFPHPISRVENNKYVRPPSTHWLQPLYPLIFPASPIGWLRNSKWLQTSPHLFSAVWIPYRSLAAPSVYYWNKHPVIISYWSYPLIIEPRYGKSPLSIFRSINHQSSNGPCSITWCAKSTICRSFPIPPQKKTLLPAPKSGPNSPPRRHWVQFHHMHPSRIARRQHRHGQRHPTTAQHHHRRHRRSHGRQQRHQLMRRGTELGEVHGTVPRSVWGTWKKSSWGKMPKNGGCGIGKNYAYKCI